MTLRLVVLVDALLMAAGHVPLIRAIFFSFPIGAYFLFATVVYVLGGILAVVRKLFKLSNFSLITLAIVDNILLIYTRTMSNIFFPRIFPWSWSWIPLGTGQILIGQLAIVALCVILLIKPGLQDAQKVKTTVRIKSRIG
jgi:hypothetical protein